MVPKTIKRYLNKAVKTITIHSRYELNRLKRVNEFAHATVVYTRFYIVSMSITISSNSV